MVKNDAYLELGHMVSKFYFIANKLDKKIDELILLIISRTQQQQGHDQRLLNALGQEIHSLNQSQDLLKNKFTETMMKFCTTDESDYAYSILQHQVPERRSTKTEEEIFLAKQEIGRLYEKQVMLRKQRKELASRFLKSFPRERGDVEICHFHDNNVSTCPNTKDDREKIDAEPLVRKETHDFRTWSLTKVMTKMYGFTLVKAKKEEEAIRNLKKTLCLASKKHRDLTEKNFINEVIGKKKRKLKGLLQAIKAITKSSEIDEEVCEAEELIMEWLYQIEREIFFLANDLNLLVSCSCDDKVAETKFREYFRSKLTRLKRCKHGRVPVVVYRILALLEGKVEGKGNVPDRRWKDDRNEKRVLFIVDQVMNKLYKMILCLMSVLNDNSSRKSDSGMSRKEKLVAYAEVVERCDEEWRALRMSIDQLFGPTFMISR